MTQTLVEYSRIFRLLRYGHRLRLSPSLLYLFIPVLLLIVDLRGRGLERGRSKVRGGSLVMLGDRQFSRHGLEEIVPPVSIEITLAVAAVERL